MYSDEEGLPVGRAPRKTGNTVRISNASSKPRLGKA